MSEGLDARIVQCIDDNYALYVSEYEAWKGAKSAFDKALSERPHLPVGGILLTLENRMAELPSRWIKYTLAEICDTYNVEIAYPENFIAGPQELAAHVYEQIGSDLAKAEIEKSFNAICRDVRNYEVDARHLYVIKRSFARSLYRKYGQIALDNFEQMKDLECVMREVFNDPFTFGIDFDRVLKGKGEYAFELHRAGYTGTYKTPGSMIKSLSIFKNRSLKIAFHNEDDMNDFTNIVPRDYGRA